MSCLNASAGQTAEKSPGVIGGEWEARPAPGSPLSSGHWQVVTADGKVIVADVLGEPADGSGHWVPAGRVEATARMLAESRRLVYAITAALEEVEGPAFHILSEALRRARGEAA